eukprot:UN02102
MLIFWQCYDFVSHEINFEGSSARNNGSTFSLIFHEKNPEKQENTVLVQKVVKIWI